MIKNRILFFIALRYLRNRNIRSFCRISVAPLIAIIGVSLSLAMLILVSSVMNGFSEELMKSLISFNAHITVYKNNNEDNSKFQKKIHNLSKIKGIKLAQGLVNENALMLSGSNFSPSIVKAIDINDLQNRKEIYNNINGDMSFFEDNNIVIGRELALKMHLKIGDSVNLMIPQGIKTIMGFMPKIKKFQIIGIVTTKSTFYDSTTIIMPLKSGMNFFNQDDINSLEIMLLNIKDLKHIQTQIQDLFKYSYITNWESENHSLIHAQKMEAAVMSLIMNSFLLLSVFTIFAIMMMTVNEKEREIAVLKSIGFSDKDIMKIFFYSGIMVIFISLVIGNAIGIILAFYIEKIRLFFNHLTGANLLDPNIYIVTYLPTKISFYSILNYNLVALFFGIIASLIPARKASLKSPVLILKNI